MRSYINNQDNTIDESYTLWTNFLDEGIPDSHSRQFTATYEVPLEKFPFLAFAKATYTYTADFNWQRNSQQFAQLDGIPNLGNSVQNANTHRINSNLDLSKLYSFVGLEKKKFGAAARKEAQQRTASRSRSRLPRSNEEMMEKLQMQEEVKIPKRILQIKPTIH